VDTINVDLPELEESKRGIVPKYYRVITHEISRAHVQGFCGLADGAQSGVDVVVFEIGDRKRW
jgi:hypothetical protein